MVMILFFTSVFASAIKIKSNENPLIMKTIVGNDAEIPIWGVGNFWKYYIKFSGYNGSGEPKFDIEIDSIEFQVVDDSSDVYNLSIGDINGNGSLSIISGNFEINVTGFIHVNKSNMKIEGCENIHLDGVVKNKRGKVIANIDVYFYYIDLEPFYLPYVFPINVDDKWIFNTTVINADIHIEEPAIIKNIFGSDLYYYIESLGYIGGCEGKEIIEINQNKYQTLKIDGNKTDFWYSFEAGNIVRAKNTGNKRLYLWDISNWYIVIDQFELKLLSTNYGVSNKDKPSIPNKPRGETNGVTNVSYSYSTSATDTEDYFIKYGWDWNGDMTVDYWTDFVESGKDVSESHKYSRNGTYRLRVKAMDFRGEESDWSESLIVEIIKNYPPIKPTIKGPSEGVTRREYTFIGRSTDPDENQIYYLFDWGDGSQSQWLGPKNSGENITKNNSWSSKGDYAVKVKAKDEYGAESVWSDPVSISLPRSRHFSSFFINIINSLKHKFSSFKTDNKRYIGPIFDFRR